MNAEKQERRRRRKTLCESRAKEFINFSLII
jgi:hypothetical protein